MSAQTTVFAEQANRRRLLNVNEAADLLGVTPRFIRRLVAERRVPYLKIGKFIRFDPDELTDWIHDQRVEAS